MTKLNPQTCYSKQALSDYLNEKLSEAEESNILTHLGNCPQCQENLELAAGSPTVWADVRKSHSPGRLSKESESIGDTSKDDRIQRVLDLLSPTDHPTMMGRIGHYEVSGLIGLGSTGVVFKALEPRLNRFVAIKILSPSYSNSGAARKRFEREARAVAAVVHQNIVPIFAVAEQNGCPYIVMQYIPGMSLLQRIEKNGPLDTCEVTRIGLQISQGLAEAHQQGVIHRDVKPANVMLENNVDRAMVTDFGLARVADEASMTQSGIIAGTPQYMSPEQAKGEMIDARSDLFSLGSLLYAACTARPPFRSETLFGVINRVCTTEPRPIREINPLIESWLCDFVARLMDKNKNKRFQSAKEVAKTLASELAYLQNPTMAPCPTREWRPEKEPRKSGIGEGENDLTEVVEKKIVGKKNC